MKKKKQLTLTLLYIVFLIVLFEGSARLWFLIPQVSERSCGPGSTGGGESLAFKRSWISRHQTGLEIYYKFDIYDSSKGWISRPYIRDMKVFDNKVLNTNSKGFRGKAEYTYSKPKAKVRILILGDSFTFGDEVSDSETYSYYVQNIIPDVEIINFGVHGYGHDQMLILLKEDGIKYEPDIIILGFVSTVMGRNLLNFRDYAKPKFVFDNKKLRLTGTPVPTPEETIKWDWARPRIVDIVSCIRNKLMDRAKEKKDVTTAILTEIIKTANSIQAIPIFVYLPTFEEISVPNLTWGETYLFSMCKTNRGVRCFSARPRFVEEMAKGVTFKNGGHWDPAGNLAIAEAIKSASPT